MNPIAAKEEFNKALASAKELHGWTWQWDLASRRFGQCRPRTKVISISLQLVAMNNKAEAVNTFLHEMAHALENVRYGRSNHDFRWKCICVEIGAKPQRCYGAEVLRPRS